MMRLARERGEAPEVSPRVLLPLRSLSLSLIVDPRRLACDQCRKTKSKCERISDTMCTNCTSMDTGNGFASPRCFTDTHIRHSLHFCRFVDDPSRSSVFLIHPCSSTGPSYKRGPPKGYINAIEQRMQHFEALLGAIMQTSDPRALSLIADLRQDELARAILNRVDAGRFVCRVRLSVGRLLTGTMMS